MKSAPAPDERAAVQSHVLFHPSGDLKILGTMISSNTAGRSMTLSSSIEHMENCECAIVIMGADPEYEAGIAVDDAMDHNFVSNETWKKLVT